MKLFIDRDEQSEAGATVGTSWSSTVGGAPIKVELDDDIAVDTVHTENIMVAGLEINNNSKTAASQKLGDGGPPCKKPRHQALD